jgi:hypothetical protein
LVTGVDKPISEWASITNEVILQPDRNIDYGGLCLKPIEAQQVKDGVTEYSFGTGNHYVTHCELTQIQAQRYVTDKIRSFFKGISPVTPKPIIVGVSGGGDSNMLVQGLLGSGVVKHSQIIAVMMLGVPDWDLGKSRAEEICSKLGVKIKFVSADQVGEILGKKSKSRWIEDFEKLFPDTDLEVLGTLAIRLSLSHVAKQLDAQAIVLGPNLEDCLAEALLSILKGEIPPPVPVRRLDDIDFWYPLFEVPKKIVDGCFPKYSQQNYLDRYPSKMPGRSVPYYLAQMLPSLIPGIEFDLLRGVQDLSSKYPRVGKKDPLLGFDTLNLPELRTLLDWERWKNL